MAIIMPIFTVIAALCFFLALWSYVSINRKEKKINKEINSLKSNAISMTPDEFMKMRNTKTFGRGKYALSKNFEGVYVIHNLSKDMYYVGQAKEVLNRVNSHFTGSGNGDVYADYKYGDKFSISIIALENSGYDNLNDLERDTISIYNAFNKGYNKTRGNRS